MSIRIKCKSCPNFYDISSLGPTGDKAIIKCDCGNIIHVTVAGSEYDHFIRRVGLKKEQEVRRQILLLNPEGALKDLFTEEQYKMFVELNKHLHNELINN